MSQLLRSRLLTFQLLDSYLTAVNMDAISATQSVFKPTSVSQKNILTALI